MVDALTILTIPAVGFLRRLQGRDLSSHGMRLFINKFVIRLSYVVVIALMPWPHWWQGVVWGAFIGFFYLNAWHRFGDNGVEAMHRYLWFGYGYYHARLNARENWTNYGETFLGASVGVFSYLLALLI